MRVRFLTLAVLATSLAACGKSSPAEPDNTSGAIVVDILSGAGDGSYDASKGGSSNSGFSPGTITVPVNSVVKWQNNDSVAHHPLADGGSFGKVVDPAGEVHFTFSSKGSFPYHCLIHPNMTGTINVQ
jgi:plastocyanin